MGQGDGEEKEGGICVGVCSPTKPSVTSTAAKRAFLLATSPVLLSLSLFGLLHSIKEPLPVRRMIWMGQDGWLCCSRQ